MVICGIASLLLSCAYAHVAPVVTATTPAAFGLLPKKIKSVKNKPIQDDKAQSEKAISTENESRSSLMDQESDDNLSVFAPPLRDAKVRLKISGFSQVDLGIASQNKTNNNKKGVSDAPHLHIGNTNLKFEASVKKDEMVAGWLMRFNPQLNHGCGQVVDRNGIFWKHNSFGQIDAGNIKGVDDSLFKFAQNLIGGSGWWDGTLDTLFNQPDGSFACEGTDFVGSTHTATKISYATPRINDVLTLAASYTPSTVHRGNMKASVLNQAGAAGAKSKNNPAGFAELQDAYKGKYDPFGTNNITLVARLDKKCGDWTLGAALTYIHDSAEVWAKSHPNDPHNKGQDVKCKLRDTNAFGVSGLIGYDRFKFALEYMNNGKSRLPLDNALHTTKNYADEAQLAKAKEIYQNENGDKGHAGHVINAVAQYNWNDKLTCAAGYQWTHRKLNEEQKTTRHTFTKTVNYLFMPGLEGYVEADLVLLKNKNKDQEVKELSNTGFVLLLGARVSI